MIMKAIKECVKCEVAFPSRLGGGAEVALTASEWLWLSLQHLCISNKDYCSDKKDDPGDTEISVRACVRARARSHCEGLYHSVF